MSASMPAYYTPPNNMNEEVLQHFLETLKNELKNLSLETKKKYPQIKDSSEEAIIKIRNSSSTQTPIYHLTNQILYPLVQGCETKDGKVVKLCLNLIQRLITQQVIDQKGGNYITETLWMLMEGGVEEVKLLQTVTLLVTTNSVIQSHVLAKCLVVCFRLHFSKNSTVMATAGATVRQLITFIFDRLIAEDERYAREDETKTPAVNIEELKMASGVAPKGLRPCAADSYLLFQDLVQLVNADQPFWMQGMIEMTRTFGLELLETVLVSYPSIFFKHPEFNFLLKERVCALVIKLFSPNIKFRSNVPANVQQTAAFDKPYYPISMRLLRVVSVLIQKYYTLLITECEIFLSTIIKFLDPDKPVWQQSLALEVLHRLAIQPNLLRVFCECYDMKPHATNIFQDIVNSLGAYVQSLFVNTLSGQVAAGSAQAIGGSVQNQPSTMIGGMPLGPGVSPQPGFYYRSVWLPIVVNFIGGQTKATFLEMLEKTEPPNVAEGYGLSIAYYCLIDVIRSVYLIFHGTEPAVESSADLKPVKPKGCSPQEKELLVQLINSSWCGLLAALSLLLDASTEDSCTETILKSIQCYSSLCGELELPVPRDAFITALCKASLPPHYTLTVLTATPCTQTVSGHARQSSADSYSAQGGGAYGNDSDYRHQVVAVGTALPTSSLPLGAQQGPVMLTAKNLQCMRAILSISHCHGDILGSAWHLLLTTLQHLVWILGLKPAAGGALKAGRMSNETNAVITTAVMADLPVLSAMLSRLFESSQYLDDVALHHLIDALCKLSQESMEMAYNNREPSLFAVAKLLETGLVNMNRVEVLWRPLTNHLLEVCQHPHIRMREWGVEAVTYLVRAALQHKHATEIKESQKLQNLLLSPLSELSSIPHSDIRQKQLDCILQILHSSGELLSHGWPLMLNMIGSIRESHSENIIRLAFQCLQLVLTDFLPVMPWHCLPLCVDTAAKFGSQLQDLNISLTAIGLLWNISDYFFQNAEKLRASLTSESKVFPEFPGCLNMPPFDKLWMCLYARLGDLCLDSRPAVRKSAGQTLFSTIAAHGFLLHQPTWQAVLWQVLFPLLENVQTQSRSASDEKVDSSKNLLIHHTRNTAQKQWAETQVLTLSGVAKVFNTKRKLLQSLGDFPRAWALLLEHIEFCALSKNNEVSLAALKAFQEILYMNRSPSSETSSAGFSENANQEIAATWNVAWKVWYSIGMESIKPPAEVVKKEDIYIPSQFFTTALVQIFPSLFQHIRTRFGACDFERLCAVVRNAVAVPVQSDSAAFIMHSNSDASVTPLQECVLQSFELVIREALSGTENIVRLIPSIFGQLLEFGTFACGAPAFGKLQANPGDARPSDWIVVNNVPFAERSWQMVLSLYQKTASEPNVIEAGILEEIVRNLRRPLALKYNCRSQTTWKVAVTILLGVLRDGLPLARRDPRNFSGMWTELVAAVDGFLFTDSVPLSGQSNEDSLSDEAVDCQIIELLRTEVLPHPRLVPKEFVFKIMVILNKGSIHSATTRDDASGSPGVSESRKLREEFAKTCFETLLQFSLLSPDEHQLDLESLSIGDSPGTDSGAGGKVANKLAVTSLLHRFKEVLRQFVEDERLSGKCPLPRHRLSEISFVLKAIATLISSLKKAPSDRVDTQTWRELISLYPQLVQCSNTASSQVSRSLREALLQYHDLLQPPVLKT